MVDVGFDRARSTLHLCVVGPLNAATLAQLDDICTALLEAEGPCHAIFDFTAVDHIDLDLELLRRRAAEPPLAPGFERILVAPRPELMRLALAFRHHQQQAGLIAPLVARSLEEAMRLLGARRMTFRRIEACWLLSASLPLAGAVQDITAPKRG